MSRQSDQAGASNRAATHPPNERRTSEAGFFDRAVAEHLRAPVYKYYSIMGRAEEDFEARLRNHDAAGVAIEYGCGAGERSLQLARDGRAVVGIDVSPHSIEVATRAASAASLEDRARFFVMDAENLDFDSESVDLVHGWAVLHHLDLRRAFVEMVRVLRPAGRAVFMEPLGHNPLINGFRRATPEFRTIDEHPLLLTDLTLAREYFETVEVTHYCLLSLAAVPLRNSRLFRPVLRVLDALDSLVFWLPRVRFWSWYALIVLSGPRKDASDPGSRSHFSRSKDSPAHDE